MPDDTKLPATVPQRHAMPLDAMQRLAESVAKSGLFGIRTPDQALVLMSIAQAEGRHPALAARDYHIIQGAPAKKAEAMARDFLSGGGRIEWHQLDDEAADATFSHPAGGSVRIRWDQARVTKAGLGSNPMHKKYPRQMLRSRTVSEGVRTVWPTATSGFYVPEEVAEFAPSRAEPVDVTPKHDLDRFAAPTAESIDHETGEVTEAPVTELARLAAAKGRDEFRYFLKTLTDEEFAVIKPLVGTREEPGELTLLATHVDEAVDRDPFGLPPRAEPQGSQPAIEAPARDGPPEPEQPHSAPQDGAGTSGAPPDLLGDPPAENLAVPMPRDPSMNQCEFFVRQVRALLDEKPRTSQRVARVKLANESGLAKLKAIRPDLYDELQAELTRKP